jgi:hypothetical protein
MSAWRVSLTKGEFLAAAQVGLMRQYINTCQQRRDAHHYTAERDPWTTHIRGACGEAAVAKRLNRFWLGAWGLDPKAFPFDVGGYQVRTNKAPDGALRLYEEDDPAHIFILVNGMEPHFVLSGWLYAREGKVPRYFGQERGDRPPLWLVPQPQLHAMEDLPDDAILDP